MLQGNRLDLQGTVVKDYLSQLGIYRMEHHLIAEVIAEKAHLLFEHALQCRRGIDMKPGRAT